MFIGVGRINHKDRLAWFYDKVGSYTIKSSYKVAREIKENEAKEVLLAR